MIVVGKIEQHEIPSSLVFKTLTKLHRNIFNVLNIQWKAEGAKSVAIFGASDKRAITATLIFTLDGLFLPMQLIYGEKLPRAFHL